MLLDKLGERGRKVVRLGETEMGSMVGERNGVGGFGIGRGNGWFGRMSVYCIRCANHISR